MYIIEFKQNEQTNEQRRRGKHRTIEEREFVQSAENDDGSRFLEQIPK